MPKILVVDDEVHIQKIIDYKLRTAGYTVIAAGDGLEGIEKAREERPDLILLDVMMPRMDGFQALEA
ncbi:MAG: response regulator, partial [candidate division NC10 bacterium]|nr:response regulator [candidate division NC10 bacterium]